MRQTLMRVILAGLVAAVALVVVATRRYTGTAPVKLPAADCNADLWKHVYDPGRLRVMEPCTAVEGRVVSLHRAHDGDLHIALDPEQKSVLNLVNAIHSHRNLVVEIICEHPSTDSGPAAACAGFTSQVAVPGVGDRIRVTGAYVTDRENGWNEVHPVTRIEVLR